jgi:hypothetical protein
MSFLTVGEHLCRAMYYHCDNSLLRYSFYRNAASRHFRLRLARITGLNVLIGAAFSAALTVVFMAAGGVPGPDLGLLWLSVLSLAVFFSVHHLAMYYFFQPYSTDLFAKNPFFHLVTFAVSAASGAGIVMQPPIVPFTLIVFAAAIVYLAAALTLVSRYGHRTFRVK